MPWIQCYCWFYEFLNNEQKERFSRLLDQFVNEIDFVGIGIEITEEMKIAVGGWAVLLVLNRPLATNWYNSVERISIYPGKEIESRDAIGFVLDGSHYCQIHLAWEDIRDSSTVATENRNTILHEFAHCLDHSDRNINGRPTLLINGEDIDDWDRVFSREYIHNRTEIERKKIWDCFGLGAWNEYSSTDSTCVDVGELYAIATEMFFESPNELNKEAPEIYDCLAKLYRFNPMRDFPKKGKITKPWDAISAAVNRFKWN